MNFILGIALAAILALLPPNLSLRASPSNPLLLSLQPVQLTDDDGNLVNRCTSFSINQKKGFWVTAAHCVYEGESSSGVPIHYLLVDEKADLAVYFGVHAPALKLDTVPPEIGDSIFLMGYPYGSLDPVVFFGRVASPEAQLTKTAKAQVLNILGVEGQSGAPILNKRGRVIGVTQNSTRSGIVYGTTWKVLKETLKDFVER